MHNRSDVKFVNPVSHFVNSEDRPFAFVIGLARHELFLDLIFVVFGVLLPVIEWALITVDSDRLSQFLKKVIEYFLCEFAHLTTKLNSLRGFAGFVVDG